jgi:uncharacterized cupin superfamily protein
MPSLYHQPPTAVTAPLEPRGQREGADSGDPQIAWTAFDSSDDVRVGVWEAAPGGWPIVNRENTETCYIVAGRATITDDSTGEKTEISSGHVVTFPRGWSGRWDVTETIRKVYCLVVSPTDG